MAPRWVKKRDGRLEPFDEARIAHGVLRAGRRAGQREEIEALAREMATTVSLFLTREGERAPDTSQIALALEGALEETGHGQIARMVRDWREWRIKRAAEVRVRAEPGPAEGDPNVEVISLRAARPWTKQRIVKALEAEADLEQEAAEDIARAVEERVFAAGLNRISSNLLRELIDAEMFERGYSAQLGKLEVMGVPKPELERMAFLGHGKTPASLEDRVSRFALERFALDEIVQSPGAAAHRRGEIHLVGLGRPFRLASGAVCTAKACAGAPSVLHAIRTMIRATRAAVTQYDLMFGLVSPERALAPFADDEPALREAVEVFVDAVAVPYPDSSPPAPEVALVVLEAPQEPAEQRALKVLMDVLAVRGGEAAGIRLAVHLRGDEPRATALVEELVAGAKVGAGFDLVIGPGLPPASRGMIPGQCTIQVGLLNLAGLALAAGRGQRNRFSGRMRKAIEAALEAFHKRRRRVYASVARPDSPLFGQTEPSNDHGEELGDAMGLVGLVAAMRYLTGEAPADNPRVADLAREVLDEVRAELDRVAARLGLGKIDLEHVPDGDGGISLAALDVDRFPDARELLGPDPGWDTAANLVAGEIDGEYQDLRARIWLSKATFTPLVLARPLLAVVTDPAALARTIQRSLDGTSRIFRRNASSAN